MKTKPINSHHNQTELSSSSDKGVAQSYSKSDSHQNINSKIEELKKGCGKSSFVEGVIHEYDQYISCEEGIGLCPLCQAKLTSLQEAQSQFLEMLKELQSLIEELEYAEYNVTETRISALMRIYKRIEELKKSQLPRR